MFGFRDLDFGHPVLLVKKSLEIGQNSSPSSKTTEIRVNSSNLCRETETWSIGQIPVTGSRNDFRSSFPNNKLRPGRLFTVMTVKVFPEMIPVNSFSGTNNAQLYASLPGRKKTEVTATFCLMTEVTATRVRALKKYHNAPYSRA